MNGRRGIDMTNKPFEKPWEKDWGSNNNVNEKNGKKERSVWANDNGLHENYEEKWGLRTNEFMNWISEEGKRALEEQQKRADAIKMGTNIWGQQVRHNKINRWNVDANVGCQGEDDTNWGVWKGSRTFNVKPTYKPIWSETSDTYMTAKERENIMMVAMKLKSQSQLSNDDEEGVKVSLCENFILDDFCRHGEYCGRAHTVFELGQPVVSKSRSTSNTSDYHSEVEEKSTGQCKKKTVSKPGK